MSTPVTLSITRTHLANQRTYLAYMRTGLAIASLAGTFKQKPVNKILDNKQ